MGNYTYLDDDDIYISDTILGDCSQSGKETAGYAIEQNKSNLCEEGEYEVDLDDYDEFENEFMDDICDEEEKFECPPNFFEAVKRLKNLLVAVEFECAGCCKKAVGILRCVNKDFIQLFRPPGKLVTVQMFCPGINDCNTECACEANIRFDKIISVEQLANQKCPC